MARRSENGKGYEDFKAFINAIITDLGLEDQRIVFRFRANHGSGGTAYEKKYISGKGFCRLIIINSSQSRKTIEYAIAHELRHVYQYKHNMLTTVWHNDTWCSFWNGAYYNTQTETDRLFKCDGTAYNNLPWEADANNYADSIIR